MLYKLPANNNYLNINFNNIITTVRNAIFIEQPL